MGFLSELQRRTCIEHETAIVLVQFTINDRLLIGRDGHLDQSEACDLL